MLLYVVAGFPDAQAVSSAGQAEPCPCSPSAFTVSVLAAGGFQTPVEAFRASLALGTRPTHGKGPEGLGS